jgi:hypothetical protein
MLFCYLLMGDYMLKKFFGSLILPILVILFIVPNVLALSEDDCPNGVAYYEHDGGAGFCCLDANCNISDVCQVTVMCEHWLGGGYTWGEIMGGKTPVIITKYPKGPCGTNPRSYVLTQDQWGRIVGGIDPNDLTLNLPRRPGPVSMSTGSDGQSLIVKREHPIGTDGASSSSEDSSGSSSEDFG